MLKRVAQGGPLMTMAPTMQDDAFRAGVVDTTASLNDLAMVVKALNSVPLDGPLTTSEVSSGFGGRPDPFTEEAAFHSGIDFSAAKGSDVFATAPGLVVFAGPRGAYGNTVEIDHGYGIRTRYGHLSKIAVPIGFPIGTGRDHREGGFHRSQHRTACPLRSVVRQRSERSGQIHQGRAKCS